MIFLPGEVLDVAKLNEMKSYPKIANLNFIAEPGANVNSTSNPINIYSVDGDFDIPFTGGNFTLEPGRYHLNIPVKAYNISTHWVGIYNQTDAVYIKKAYGWAGSNYTMTDGILRANVTVLKDTVFNVRTTAANNYPFQGTVTMLEKFSPEEL